MHFAPERIKLPMWRSGSAEMVIMFSLKENRQGWVLCALAARIAAWNKLLTPAALLKARPRTICHAVTDPPGAVMPRAPN
jgi:hypothetical protein